MVSFGVEPSTGPEEAIYSTPLMLRWIARCTSDWIRSGIQVRSRPADALMSVLLPRTIDDRCLSIALHRRRSDQFDSNVPQHLRQFDDGKRQRPAGRDGMRSNAGWHVR